LYPVFVIEDMKFIHPKKFIERYTSTSFFALTFLMVWNIMAIIERIKRPQQGAQDGTFADSRAA